MGLALLGCLPRLAAAQPPPVEVEYYHLDAVGSVRAVTDQSGNVIRRHNYFPFGEEHLAQEGGDPLRFAGKERDAETGLDYVGARYYASRTGRFTTGDPGHVSGNIFDPQSWNAYAYARNNPLRFVDPTGTEYEVRLGNGTTLYLTNDQFDRLWEYPGAGISFEGFWDNGEVWINNGGTKYGSYRYYYGFSDAIRDAGNRAEAQLKAYVKEMALDAATVGFFGSMRFADGAVVSGLRKLPVPPLPAGMSSATFGKIMKWGTGNAEARAQIGRLSKEALERAGITREMALEWWRFYQKEALRNPANPTAAGRADLMEWVVWRLLR
jgi:RHS repeat-associated protein